MSTYRYQLIADIEVDAPNIMASERAVMGSSRFTGLPRVRGFGSYIGGVRLPSMQKGEHCYIEMRVDNGKIKRVSK